MVLKAITTLPMSVKLIVESNGTLLPRSMARTFLGAPSGGGPSSNGMPLNPATTFPMSVKLMSPNAGQTSPHKPVRISSVSEKQDSLADSTQVCVACYAL